MANLGLKIDQSIPRSTFIFVSMHNDKEFKHHFGLVKGLIIVCGQEKVLSKDTSITSYMFKEPSTQIESGVFVDLFEVDFS